MTLPTSMHMSMPMPESIPIIRQIQVKSVISKSNLPDSDYAVNPYVGCTHACKYCYASFMQSFTDHHEPWGCFMEVKYWPEIKNPQQYAGKKMFISSVTDPYNPQEAIYGRTRALLEQLQGSGARITITTKSDLILRDLELIKSFPDPVVAWSINTLNDSFRRDMDSAASISRRLAAMAAFHQAGIRTVCFISPIFPLLTNVIAIIKRVRNQCQQIWLENLNLRSGYKDVIMAYIKDNYYDLFPFYQEIYNHHNYRYWDLLDHEIKVYAAARGLAYTNSFTGSTSITSSNGSTGVTAPIGFTAFSGTTDTGITDTGIIATNASELNPPPTFTASPLLVNLFHYGSPNPNKAAQANSPYAKRKPKNSAHTRSTEPNEPNEPNESDEPAYYQTDLFSQLDSH